MNDDDLRDLYAGLAMQALITANKADWLSIPILANDIADKMIEEKNNAIRSA